MSGWTAPLRGEAPPARLRDPGRLFEARAARLRVLSEAHPAPEWVLLLSRLAAAQAVAVREVPVPAAEASGVGAPLALVSPSRDGAWRRMLRIVVSAAAAPGLPEVARAALRDLAEADAPRLDALADALLAGRLPQAQLASGPFVGAALQAWLAALASRVDPRSLSPARAACPVCGGPPVAALVHGNDRLRYVTCALCCSEWHVPRIRCTTCGAEEGLAYLHADGDRGVQAEACPACRTYLKLLDGEARPGADPAADDAASLALDLRVGEEGYARAGMNLYAVAAAG